MKDLEYVSSSQKKALEKYEGFFEYKIIPIPTRTGGIFLSIELRHNGKYDTAIGVYSNGEAHVSMPNLNTKVYKSLGKALYFRKNYLAKMKREG